jgi:AraC-like DNA-binding protein
LLSTHKEVSVYHPTSEYLVRASAPHVANENAKHLGRSRTRDLACLVYRTIDQRAADSSLSLAELARLLGVTQRRIQCALSRDGHSFSSYVRALRVTRAAALLDARDRDGQSILSIAESVGFRDISTFCRVFRKATGHSARQYRARSVAGSVPHGGQALQEVPSSALDAANAVGSDLSGSDRQPDRDQ